MMVLVPHRLASMLKVWTSVKVSLFGAALPWYSRLFAWFDCRDRERCDPGGL